MANPNMKAGEPSVNPLGRPKSVSTADCKQSFVSVYDALGGAEELLKWAKKNQTDYYKMLVAILPKEQKIEFANPLVTLSADDIARLIVAIGRNRNFAVPSSIERIAGQEAGALPSVQQTESIS